MKPGQVALGILGMGLMLGVIVPPDITEIIKGTGYTFFRMSGTLDQQVEKSHQQVRESDRPWNRRFDGVDD